MINKKVFVLGFLIFIIIGVSPINAETDDIPIKSKMNNSKDYSDNKTVSETKTVKNVTNNMISKNINKKSHDKKEKLKSKSKKKKKIKKKIVNKNKLTKLTNKKLVHNKEEVRKTEESMKLSDYSLGLIWKATVALSVLTLAGMVFFLPGRVKAPVVK